MKGDELDFPQRILIIPQHGIILLGKKLQLLRRKLVFDLRRLRRGYRRIISSPCSCSRRRTPRLFLRTILLPHLLTRTNRPSPSTRSLIKHTPLLLPNPLNPPLNQLPLPLSRSFEPIPQKPKYTFPHRLPNSTNLLISDLLGGFIIIV